MTDWPINWLLVDLFIIFSWVCLCVRYLFPIKIFVLLFQSLIYSWMLASCIYIHPSIPSVRPSTAYACAYLPTVYYLTFCIKKFIRLISDFAHVTWLIDLLMDCWSICWLFFHEFVYPFVTSFLLKWISWFNYWRILSCMSSSSSACLHTFINSSLVQSYLEQYCHIVPEINEFRLIRLCFFFSFSLCKRCEERNSKERWTRTPVGKNPWPLEKAWASVKIRWSRVARFSQRQWKSFWESLRHVDRLETKKGLSCYLPCPEQSAYTRAT